MVSFTPDVAPGKDGVPDWTKITKPTDSYIADKSTGLAIAGVGQGIENVAGIAEKAANDYISKETRRAVEPIREDYTNKLLQTKAIVQGVDSAIPSQKPPQDLSLMGEMEEVVPPAVKMGLNKIDRIQNMLKYGSGKFGVDETYYDMQLKTAVVNLRERFPGFVDKIDSEVSRIVGMNPANELVRDAQRQIAQLQSNKKSEFDKELDLARGAMSKGMDGADKMIKFLESSGEAGIPAFRQWYTEENAKFTRLSYEEQLAKSMDRRKADFKDTRLKQWTNVVGGDVSNAMNTLITVTGMKEGTTAMKLLEDFQKNPGMMNEEQMKEFATKLKAQGATISAALDMKARKVVKADDGTEFSYNTDLTPAVVQQTKKEILGYYDLMHDALWNGGPQGAGMAFYWAQQAAGQLATTRAKVYAGPAGANVKMWHVLRDEYGDTAVPTLMQGTVKAGVDQTVSGLLETTMLKAKTNTPDETGAPVTFKSMGDKALSLEQNKEINSNMRARYMKGGMDIMMKDIQDPAVSEPAKYNAIKFFFSPEGQGVLNSFNNDRYNPITKKSEPGKQTIWNQFTSDATVSAVKQLSDKYPEIGLMYRQFIEREAGAELFYKDLLNLNTFTGRDDIYFKYNDGKKGGVPYIEVLSDRGSLESPVGKSVKAPSYGVRTVEDYDRETGIDIGKYQQYPGKINGIQATVNRINTALQGLNRVSKAFEGDASAELLSFMVRSQVDLGKNWEGLPEKLLEAVRTSQGKGKLEDAMKAK